MPFESQGSEADFWSLLDERLVLAKSPDDPYRTAGNVKARVAPILYMEGACGVRLKADDSVTEIFKTAAPHFTGYIGIHETINA